MEAERLESVDVLRGLVMVVMALDHVRDFLSSAPFDPVDLARTDAAYFFTRWITHFCAPTFSFLAGTGAFLSLSRGKSRRELARFLVTRGLWLIVLEMAILRFAWHFNARPFTEMGTLWALGVSMVVLAPLVWLPAPVVGVCGVGMIAGHNAFDAIHAKDLGGLQGLWVVLHEQGRVGHLAGLDFFLGYPVVPWIGVMAAGYAFGGLLLAPRSARRRTLVALGAAVTLAFLVLRATNLYGDPAPWSRGKSGLFTLMSFLNCEKYPPSLLFLLMTLGPSIAALAWLDREPGAAGRALQVFGRVPFFFYVIHIPLAHVVSLALTLAEYPDLHHPAVRWIVLDAPWLAPPPPGFGFPLPVVYVVWFALVAALFPACRWYAGLKRRRTDWWLGYL